jgi:hypothetical protein
MNVVFRSAKGDSFCRVGRALQYLVERGYFTPDDLPAIRRAIDDAGRDDYQRLTALARRVSSCRSSSWRAFSSLGATG